MTSQHSITGLGADYLPDWLRPTATNEDEPLLHSPTSNSTMHPHVRPLPTPPSIPTHSPKAELLATLPLDMKVTRPEQLSLPIPPNSPQPPVYSAPDLKPATRRASLVKAGNSRASDLGPSSSRTPAVPESDELFDPASLSAAAGYHDYRSGHVRRVEGSSMGGYASTLNYPGLSPQALPSSLPPLSRNGRIPEDRYEYPPEKATLTMTAEIELMSPSFDPYGAGDPGTHLSRQRRAALEEVDNANFS